jgi:hypothetical protein
VLSLLAAALIAQAPENLPPRTVAVLSTSKRPAVDQYISVLTGRTHALLAREGVAPLLEEAAGIELLKQAGVTDPRSCQGGRACVARMAVILGSRAVVVGIDVGKAGASLSIIMEAVAAETGKPLLTSEFEVPIANYSDASALPVTLFARELKKKLDAERPAEPEVVVSKPVTDVPLVTKLDPPPLPRPEPIPAVVEAPSRTKRVLGFTLVGGAVVSAGTGGVLALVGNGAKNKITASLSPGNPQVSELPRSELKSLEGQANGAFTGALIGLIAAGVLTAVAIYCFASDS